MRKFHALLLFCLLGFASPTGQETRTNRVWSVWVTIDVCDAEVSTIWEHVEDQRRVSRGDGVVILQWSVDTPEGYNLLDLIEEMSAKIYHLEIEGSVLSTDKSFSKHLWVSPIGASPERIEPKMPTRGLPSEDRIELYDRWFHEEHYWVHKNIEREVQFLAFRFDHSIGMLFNIEGAACPRVQLVPRMEAD